MMIVTPKSEKPIEISRIFIPDPPKQNPNQMEMKPIDNLLGATPTKVEPIKD